MAEGSLSIEKSYSEHLLLKIQEKLISRGSEELKGVEVKSYTKL